MCEWARRMHRHASLLGDVMLCGQYMDSHSHWSIEKVKFGVPLESFCSDELPGPLLVLLLKLNKEGCDKKDVFRAPGHEAAMKKLQYSLHVGRLINFENYSVNTVASVIKKFLRKIPGGVFTTEGEIELFATVTRDNEQQLQETRNVIKSLPICTQKLLCVLLGTFKAIATSAEVGNTGMSAEAIGVSVAPSFFHSCVADGRRAMLSDVQRFKVASRIMRFIIDQFYDGNLFDMPIYEYYSRVSGRIFTVNNTLVCSPLPPELPAEQRLYATTVQEEEDVEDLDEISEAPSCPAPVVLDGIGDDQGSPPLRLILRQLAPTPLQSARSRSCLWHCIASCLNTISCGLCGDCGADEDCCLRGDDPDLYEMVTVTPSPSNHPRGYRHLSPVPESSSSSSSAGPSQASGPQEERQEWSPTHTAAALLDRSIHSSTQGDSCSAPVSRSQSPAELIHDQSEITWSFCSTQLSQLALQVGKTWYQCQCNRWGIKKSEGLTEKESSASMPALCQPGPNSTGGAGDVLDSIPEHSLLDSRLRLSSSLEDTVFMDPQPSTSRANTSALNIEDLRPLVVHTQTAKSLNCLPQMLSDVGGGSTGIACGCAAEVPLAGLHEPTTRSRSLSSLVK